MNPPADTHVYHPLGYLGLLAFGGVHLPSTRVLKPLEQQVLVMLQPHHGSNYDQSIEVECS
jgi:hypothetical protein